VGFELVTGFTGHKFLIGIHNLALLLFHSLPAVQYVTHNLPGFPNCPCPMATATLDSQCTHKPHPLELPPPVTGYIPTTTTVLSAALSSNYWLLKVRSWFCDRQSVGQFVLVSFVWQLLASSCRVPSLREDGSVVCNAITDLSESRRTHNHILRSHLRLPQPGGPGSPIYISPPRTGWPSYTSGHWVPFMLPLTTCRTTVEVF
jgi:hypothetical protein